MTRNLSLGLIIATVLFAAFAAPAAACAGADTPPAEQGARAAAAATLCLVNAERAAAGLAPVRVNRLLARVGRTHAADMVRRRYFSHASLEGRGAVARAAASGYGRGRHAWVGENLAIGVEGDDAPRNVVQGWMDSPPHRRTMLFERFREAGVGIVSGSPRGGVATTYALELGG